MQRYDAVVVLNGGSGDNGKLFEDTKNRIIKGLETAQKLKISNLVVGGKDADAMKQFAKSALDKTSNLNILSDNKSANTIENAHYTKLNVLIPNKWQSIIIVTDRFHSARAKLTFELVLGPDFDVSTIDSKTNYSTTELKQLAKQEEFFVKLTKSLLKLIGPEHDHARQNALNSLKAKSSDYFKTVRK